MITAMKKNDYGDLRQGLQRLITIICVGCFFVINNAHGFDISPNRIEVTIPTAKAYSGEIAVANSEQRDLYIKLRLGEWFSASYGTDWLHLNPLEFELKKGESRKVSYKISVPKNAKGELSAMIFVDAKPQEAQAGPITINTSVGIPIYAAIQGTERMGAEVEELAVVNSAPLKLSVKVKNTGNVHIRPTGAITIKAKTGGDALSVPLNEYNYPVLPVSSRILEIKTDKRLEPGTYVADIKMGFSDRTYSKRMKIEIK